MSGPGERVSLLAYAGVLGFVALVHGAWFLLGDTIVAHGGLADGDSFTHLIRAERLWLTKDWYDVTIPGANAPFGTTVHWTRLFDVLLLNLAVPLSLFFDLKTAVYVAGVVVSPLLHLGLAAAVVWGTRPLIGAAAAVIAGALTATQFGILAFAIAGRADHHMLFALFAALTLGCVARALAADGGKTDWPRWTGLALAAGVWVGPEFLLFAVLVMVGLAWPWLRGATGATGRNLDFARGFVLGLAVAGLIERGLGLTSFVEFDRLSIVHVAMGGVAWLFWLVTTVAERRGRLPATTAKRLAWAMLGAAGAAAIVWGLFPDALGNPLTRGNPEIVPIFRHISEYGGVADAAQFLIYFGSAVPALPWMAWRCRAWLRTPLAGAWLVVGSGVLVYLAFGVGWIRWALYAALFLAIVLADLVIWADAAIDRRFRLPTRIPIKVLVLGALIIGPLGLAGAIRYAEAGTGKPPEAVCPIDRLSAFLNTPPWAASPQTIVASANFGPELLYRTPHRVLATVHHRNIAGILDGHRILGGGDDAAVRKLITVRGVDLLVLCPGSRDDGYFVNEGEANHLYGRLEAGAVPDWLAPVTMLPDLAEHFKLFAVHLSR